jgi:hypothetical protein
MNQPEQARQQDIAKFLKLSALGSGKRQRWQLSYRTAYSDFTFAEMVDDAEPVLMVDGGEVPFENLRVNQ